MGKQTLQITQGGIGIRCALGDDDPNQPEIGRVQQQGDRPDIVQAHVGVDDEWSPIVLGKGTAEANDAEQTEKREALCGRHE
jgi:hypothetical protein